VHSGTKDDAMNFDVFISYPHQEKATADAVCATLEAAGIRCWIAPRDVPGGAEWADAIVDAIDHCKAMVLVFSSHTNGSKQILREVQRAFDREKPVLPVRIEKVAPESGLAYYMGPVHWLDAFTPPLQQHLQNLRRSVEAVVKSTASVPPEPGGGAPPKEFSDAVSSGNSAANVSAKLPLAAGINRYGCWQLRSASRFCSAAPDFGSQSTAIGSRQKWRRTMHRCPARSLTTQARVRASCQATWRQF
jgi:hypothetical protein